MSYTNHLFEAINQMANEFGDEPPTSVKVVVALSLLCQTELEILEDAKKKAAERIEAVKPVVKKRGRKRKYCLYSGEPLTGRQTKFASSKYAQAYWRENNREKARKAYRKWYQKQKSYVENNENVSRVQRSRGV
jgi:serine/threonine-protein kinase RIO1|tara:strand:+ start:305 stop:706 length:402 start_codon:yes stop_codon:yes gene_type:complete